jgi:hypothetical protein
MSASGGTNGAATSEELLAVAIPLNYQVGHENVSFFCPIFLGHPEARGRCYQGKKLLYGRDPRCLGGTEKAEATKLRGAGIGPKQCPGKCVTTCEIS